MGVASEAGGRSYSEFCKSKKKEWNLNRKACRNIFPGACHSEKKHGKGYRIMGGRKTAAFCYLEANKYLDNYLSPQSAHAVNYTHLHIQTRNKWNFMGNGKNYFWCQRFLLPLWEISSQGLLLLLLIFFFKSILFHYMINYKNGGNIHNILKPTIFLSKTNSTIYENTNTLWPDRIYSRNARFVY